MHKPTVTTGINAILAQGKEEEKTMEEFLYLDETLLQYYNPKLQLSPNALRARYKNVCCVNCGEKGHVVRECNGPITSYGIIAFKVVHSPSEENNDKNANLENILNDVKIQSPYYVPPHKERQNASYPKIKFLMIQRKDTMGYTDFVRGKYPDPNVDTQASLQIIKTCLDEMTIQEKHRLKTMTFDEIWKELWVNHESKCFRNEYEAAKRKFSKLDIPSLLNLSTSSFAFTEFGFPKGRRNMKETNIACAEREFIEETGYGKTSYEFIKNYRTIHEEFVGTNGVQYRHVYYLVKMKGDIPPPRIDHTNKIQAGEVKNIGWFTYDECLALLRPYDQAKKSVISKVYNDLLEMKDDYQCSSIYTSGRRFENRSFSSFNKNPSYFKGFYYTPKNYFVHPRSI